MVVMVSVVVVVAVVEVVACDNDCVSMLSVVAMMLMGAVVVTSGRGVGGSCGSHGVYCDSGCVVMLMSIEAMLVVAMVIMASE